MAMDGALLGMSERLSRLEGLVERLGVRETVRAIQSGVSVGVAFQDTLSATYVTLDGNGTGSELRVDLVTSSSMVIAILLGTYRNSAAGNSIFTAIAMDGGAEAAEQYATSPGASYGMTIINIAYYTGVSAGAHYWKGRWRTDAGTATAVTDRRRLIVLEIPQ